MPPFKGWINPLKCPEIDLDLHGHGTPPADRLLDYLFAPELDRSREAFVARYREITAVDDPLLIVPAEAKILEKIVWPLRHAIGAYALGNCLGCITLCGIVGEMVAILLWEISKATLQGRPLDEAKQKELFGSGFEKLGQERRTQVLRVFNLIDDETKTAFDRLRDIRRKYLHLFSQSPGQLSDDALRAYKVALQVVAVVLGQKHTDGGVVLRPDLMSYLKEKGIIG